MKNFNTLFLFFLLITISVFAQSPEKMSYQAVIRDASNTLVTNQSVGMQISILQTTTTGTAVYTETQTVTTNTNGLVSLEIGMGDTSDDFSAIDWKAGPYFIKTETDPTGGSSYTITGTSQLLSVPFAMYAKSSGSSETNATNIANNTTSIETNTIAIELNTAKVGITAQQASDITSNNAKTGITTEQSDAIVTNTAKSVSNGADGYSAYQVAVVNGYQLDEASWLASLIGTSGADGADGVDGNSGGAVGVSFSMDLRGTPTTWAGSGAPPATVSVEPLGPYILYTGEDSTNNGIIPRLPKNFEFIHLEGNSWASAPNPNPGYFPSTEWVQSVNLHETVENNHKLSQLGPISNGSLTSYNNFYGFRVPQDGKMVGFQINYIQKAMTGQFYAMYYKPDSENPTVIFNKGGPLVGGMNSSGQIQTNYASGNTIWDEATSIPVKANGFIFVMSDLSCRSDGAYTDNWNSEIGPGPAIPFRPPSGKIHATVYLTYD